MRAEVEKQALLDYQKAVLTALTDVESALAKSKKTWPWTGSPSIRQWAENGRRLFNSRDDPRLAQVARAPYLVLAGMVMVFRDGVIRDAPDGFERTSWKDSAPSDLPSARMLTLIAWGASCSFAQVSVPLFGV